MHTRWGIVIRQNVCKRRPQQDDVVLGHQYIMKHGGPMKEHELDMVDHNTGVMLQRLGAPNPHTLGMITDVDLSEADIRRILSDPA